MLLLGGRSTQAEFFSDVWLGELVVEKGETRMGWSCLTRAAGWGNWIEFGAAYVPPICAAGKGSSGPACLTPPGSVDRFFAAAEVVVFGGQQRVYRTGDLNFAQGSVGISWVSADGQLLRGQLLFLHLLKNRLAELHNLPKDLIEVFWAWVVDFVFPAHWVVASS